jgi:hypothetical protein
VCVCERDMILYNELTILFAIKITYVTSAQVAAKCDNATSINN